MYTSKIVFNDDNGNRKQFYRDRPRRPFGTDGKDLGPFGFDFAPT